MDELLTRLTAAIDRAERIAARQVSEICARRGHILEAKNLPGPQRGHSRHRGCPPGISEGDDRSQARRDVVDSALRPQGRPASGDRLARRDGDTMTGRRHKIQSPVVNGVHLYECRVCGRQWLPGQEPGPDATTCPGRQP